MKSRGPCTALVHTEWYKAASSNPTIAAFVPRTAACAHGRRKLSQNGNTPTTSKPDGKKIPPKQSTAPIQPPGRGGVSTAPR